MRSKERLGAVLLVSVALIVFLITSCASPVIAARDRRFLDLSLEFLAEYELPKMNFSDTPVGGITAITYDRQRDRFYALSDDSSQFAPARFYTLKLNLDSTKEIGIQKIDVESVTFLTDNDGKIYPKGTIKPGGIALTPQKSVFISTSGVAPSVQEFDLKTGQMLQSLPIPERYLPNAVAEKNRTSGVQETSAFTSLTLNPTGTIPASGEPFRVFTATQSALLQDLEPSSQEIGAKCRLLHYLITFAPPTLIAEHVYPLEPIPSDAISNGLVELLAVDTGGHFLSLERSKGASGFNARIFQIATGGATDTSTIPSLKGEIKGVQPVKKKLLLDLKELGISLDNLQGMTLGSRLPDGTKSLLLVSDDSFNESQATQFLLFRLKSGR